MTEAISTVLFWYGLLGIAIFIGGLLIARWFDGKPSQIAEREAKALPWRITREFLNRPRLCVARVFDSLFTWRKS